MEKLGSPLIAVEQWQNAAEIDCLFIYSAVSASLWVCRSCRVPAMETRCSVSTLLRFRWLLLTAVFKRSRLRCSSENVTQEIVVEFTERVWCQMDCI